MQQKKSWNILPCLCQGQATDIPETSLHTVLFWMNPLCDKTSQAMVFQPGVSCHEPWFYPLLPWSVKRTWCYLSSYNVPFTMHPNTSEIVWLWHWIGDEMRCANPAMFPNWPGPNYKWNVAIVCMYMKSWNEQPCPISRIWIVTCS